MRDDDLARAGTRRLPPAALTGLHEAFRTEVAMRLPALQAAVETGHPCLLSAAARHAHALGSSAAVVGEPDASRAARAVEALLIGWEAGDGDIPLTALRTQVRALAACLSGWVR